MVRTITLRQKGQMRLQNVLTKVRLRTLHRPALDILSKNSSGWTILTEDLDGRKTKRI